MAEFGAPPIEGYINSFPFLVFLLLFFSAYTEIPPQSDLSVTDHPCAKAGQHSGSLNRIPQ